MSDGRFKAGVLYNKVSIIGVGLIGGSLGIRLRERRLVKTVSGYNRSPESLVKALERGAIDQAAASASEAVHGAELVVLAVPVAAIPDVFQDILPALSPGTTVTDVGSTKLEIMRAVAEVLPEDIYFIGGHPMAGSEESGIKAADPALLENALYVLTPPAGTPPEKISRLYNLVEATGAQPLIMDPAEHDQVAALVSHLPHLTAAALVNSVSGAGRDELVRTLAAGGFRDTTRIALSSPALWRDICMSNRGALLDALSVMEKNIRQVRVLLSRNDGPALERYMEQAREFRQQVPHRGRGILPDLHELVVLVPDTPGVIGRLAGLLGKRQINISSIEILHVRELEGGSIRLGFREAGHLEAALQALKEEGYRCHRRT